jgi:alpha-tubulin suppressor-like RCC1 family protein
MRIVASRMMVVCVGAALVSFGAVTACGGDDVAATPSDGGPLDAARDTSLPRNDSGGGDDAAPLGDGAIDAGEDGEGGDAGIYCALPQLRCNGICVSIDSSNANCGACGRACPGAATCSGGHCSSAVAKVAAGEKFACAVKYDGTVWCWGSNDFGVLGVAPSSADQTCGAHHCNKTPQQITGLTDVASIAAGTQVACAAKKNGSVWCWGKNQYGELGHAPGTAGDVSCADGSDGGATVSCNPTPAQVSFPASAMIAGVSAGEDVVCARTVPAASDAAADAGAQGGDVYCWGDNVHDTVGLLGPDGAVDPTHQPTPTPNKVSVFTSDVIDVHVALGSHHACAVRAAGTVWCWGDDGEGRIGTLPGTDIDCTGGICTPNPMQIKLQTVVDAGGDAAGDTVLGAALSGAKMVRVGAEASCALKSDGSVWCWGSDQLAALADKGPYADPFAHPGARQILQIPAVKSIARHGATSFAIDSTGSAFAWGENSFGELGTGKTAGAACPVGLDAGTCISPPVLAQPHLRDLSAGVHLVVAIKDDDTVWAWGKNGQSELGHAPGASGDTTCSGPFESASCNATPSEVTFP